MTPAEKDKLARLNTVAKALAEAARVAWEKGHLSEAAGLYSSADVAESRAHYFELSTILRDDEAAARYDLRGFGGGRLML